MPRVIACQTEWLRICPETMPMRSRSRAPGGASAALAPLELAVVPPLIGEVEGLEQPHHRLDLRGGERSRDLLHVPVELGKAAGVGVARLSDLLRARIDHRQPREAQPPARREIPRVERDQPLQTCNGLRELSVLGERAAEIQPAVRASRIGFDRAPEAGDRVREPALRLERIAEIDARRGGPGRERKRLPEARLGIGIAAPLAERHAEVVVRLGHVRVERNGLVEALPRRVDAMQREQGAAERIVRDRAFSVDPARLLEAARSALRIAADEQGLALPQKRVRPFVH